MRDKLLKQFNETLNEGLSSSDLADILHSRLTVRYPDVLDKYGYDAVEDAVNDVASFHAGVEELGTSDVSIMIKEILKSLDSHKLDELAMPYSEFKDQGLWGKVVGSAGHKIVRGADGAVMAVDQLGHHAGGFDPNKKVWYVKGSSINEEGVDQTPGVRAKYRATVEYGPTAADAKFVTVTAGSTEEAEQKVEAWCAKNGIRNPMITINGADLPNLEEADKHSFIGRIQRHHELKKKVDSTWDDAVNAEKQGDKAGATRAFNKHVRYTNLERPGTFRDVKDQEDEQGVAEGFPYDVDHMNGPIIRNADMTTDNVKVTNKQDWDRAVSSINSRVFDDNAEFISNNAGTKVEHDGVVFAIWGNSSNVGWFNAKGRPLKPHKLDVAEDWQKVNKHDKTDGMSKKAVSAYRRENPGSKLKTAVTTKPSKLKPGSKDANRRKSFCARMSGVKGPMKDEHGKPTAKAKALSRWNCHEDVAEAKRGLMGDNGRIEEGDRVKTPLGLGTVDAILSLSQKVGVHLDSGQHKDFYPEDVNVISQQGVAEDSDPCWDGYKQIGMKNKGGKKVPNCVPVEENLGTPYPGTYEQENKFKSKGTKHTQAIAFEDRYADVDWRDAIQSGKAVAQQAPAKYFLKDRATGKVLGRFNSAPEAVRGSMQYGGHAKCKVEVMREDELEEAGYYNPLDQERREQDQMDYGKRAFKQREHDAEWEIEKRLSQQRAEQEAGTWYIRINGKIFKDRATGEPAAFNGKKHANAVAIKMMQKDFNKGKEFMLTTKPVDQVKQLAELSTEKLAQYKTAASKDASAADKAGNFKRGDKRFSGIVKATNKQFANDAKPKSSISEGINQVDEGWKSALAGAALAGMAAFGGGAAHAAPVDGMSTPYLQSVVSGEAGRPLVSVDTARQELQARQQGKQQKVSAEPSQTVDQNAPRGANLKPEVLQQLKAGTYKGWAPKLSPQEIDAALAYQQGNQ